MFTWSLRLSKIAFMVGISLCFSGILMVMAQEPPTAEPVPAYLVIVNTGDIDRLTGVRADGVGSAQLQGGADGVVLRPHTRTALSVDGTHIVLTGLAQTPHAGDVIALTLVFKSGQEVEIPFDVRAEVPAGRLNFMTAGTFQFSNAWIMVSEPMAGAAIGTPYQWNIPAGVALPAVPADNPMTVEKVELGRYLFYDVQLSGNQTQSCGTCHIQSLAFTDARPTSIGSTGDHTPRNSMSLTNIAYNATLTWANPNLLRLERQVVIPMFGEFPIELGITGHEEEVLNRFRQDPVYQAMFEAAFGTEGDPFTFANITRALASFTRSLISLNSGYDRYVQGDRSALSESARRGMELFLSERFECHHCHTGFNFTLSTVTATSTLHDRPFFNTGLYNIGGTGAYPIPNTGVFSITNNPSDMGRFRPPTLRNVALTAPYMHDGSIQTLEEVLQFYMSGGRNITEGDYAGDGRANPYKSGFVPGFTMTAQEQADMLAFLYSLTDESFISDPRFSNPFEDGTS